MRVLVRKLLDDQISRRDFVREIVALGVTVSSAEALLGSVSVAAAAETAGSGSFRQVTGNGADVMVETLLEADVEYIFHGCGAGTNTIFDSIVTRPRLKNILATNEGQCVAMAEGYHLASGKIGVVIIPKAGLGNAAGNIYNALMDRSSVLVITARDSSEFSKRLIDLEMVDWQEVMDPFMRSSYMISNFNRVSEFTRRAITVANTPPGGPTFLQLTEDMYDKEGTASIFPQVKFDATAAIEPEPEKVMAVARMLLEAERPLITVGPEVTQSGGQKQMIELAELLSVPVTGGLSGFADFPNQHPLFLGAYRPFLPQAHNADFYLCLGSQLPDEASYVHQGPPPPAAKLVHVTIAPGLLGMTYPADVNVVGSANLVISGLIDAVKSLASDRKIRAIRQERFGKIKAATDGMHASSLKRAQQNWDKAPMTVARIMSDLDATLDDDAIIVKEPVYGADDWLNLGYGAKTLLSGSGAGVLGWATGAALGAKLAQPDRQVVALTGDGAFMFQHNLWALSRYDAPVIVIVINNHAYNMTRAFTWLRGGQQAKQGKDLLNYLGNPDVNFSLIAQAHGVKAEVVTDPSELKPAFKRAIQATEDGRPYLLDISNERWGKGGELTWHPDISIARMRTRAARSS